MGYSLHSPLILISLPSVMRIADLDDRRSTTGFCIYLGSNLINWGAKKQAVVARSSTEAEYRSLANTVVEIAWVQSLLSELIIPAKQAPSIFCDNLSTVLLSANLILHARTKHIELDLHFVHEKVQRGQIKVVHVPSHEQTTDILTKPTSPSSFTQNRTKLRVLPLPTLSLRGVKGKASNQLIWQNGYKANSQRHKWLSG